MDFLSSFNPLNVTAAVYSWDVVLLGILGTISPLDGTAIFYPLLEIFGLSSFSIIYDRTSIDPAALTVDSTSDATSNSSANSDWMLSIQYTRNNETSPKIIPITFNVTGGVELTLRVRDFNLLNHISFW